MAKVLIFLNRLAHYRTEVFNELNKQYDVTVVCSSIDTFDNIDFKVVKCDIHPLWKFNVHDSWIYSFARLFDVIVLEMNPNLLSEWILMMIPNHSYGIVTWGIGVPASYNVKYDEPSKRWAAMALKAMIKRADASIFYSDYPREKYIKKGIDGNRLFVAHNTVFVNDNRDKIKNKKHYLFVGSLYKAKGTGILLEAYYDAKLKVPNLPKLLIVGEGSERSQIEEFVKKKHLEDSVHLCGAVYDEDILEKYYAEAIMCVSPNQAGLSVQKSMGYGCPFITRCDAITGGEIFDIKNGVNGIKYDKDDDLSTILLDAAETPEKYIEMGKNAQMFYYSNRTIGHMLYDMNRAIQYALKFRRKTFDSR